MFESFSLRERDGLGINSEIVCIDSAHANTPPYTQAVANLRLVGSYVAKFVQHLVDVHGADPAKIHIIGHR